MKKINRIFVTLSLIAILFTSCSKDETMDEIIDKREINNPSYTDDDGDGKDTPIGGDEGG